MRLLRRYSLDELPQLVNMSARRDESGRAAPRAAVAGEPALLAARRASECGSLLPGLTGWAQINGRDDLDDAAKADVRRRLSETTKPRLRSKNNGTHPRAGRPQVMVTGRKPRDIRGFAIVLLGMI